GARSRLAPPVGLSDPREHAHCDSIRSPGSRSRGVTVTVLRTSSADVSPGTPVGWLGRLAHFTTRYRWPVIAVWLVLTVIGVVAAGGLSTRWYQSTAIPGKPAYETGQRV